MDLIQVSATFVVPEDKANDFSTALSGWVDRLHILDHLLAHDWAYLGVWQEEWLADPPSVEDILRFSGSRIKEKFSREKLETLWRELTDIPVNEEGEIEETFIHFPIGTDKIEVWLWFDKQEFEFPWAVKFSREKIIQPCPECNLEQVIHYTDENDAGWRICNGCSIAFKTDRQEAYDEKFSREKNASPSLDKESSHVRSNIARKIHLAMSKRAKAVKKIPLDLRLSDGGRIVQKVNVGVAKHVITRKHYPDPRCKTLCTMMNTDYCRLKCDQDRLEPLD